MLLIYSIRVFLVFFVVTVIQTTRQEMASQSTLLTCSIAGTVWRGGITHVRVSPLSRLRGSHRLLLATLVRHEGVTSQYPAPP